MKKESTVAIVLGICLGLIVALVLILKSKQPDLSKTKSIQQMQITPTISIKNDTQFQTLEVIQPSDNLILSTGSVTIKANVAKNSLVVIQSPLKDMELSIDKSSFSQDFPLALGENVIRITVYPKDQKMRTQEKLLRIYYLDEQ